MHSDHQYAAQQRVCGRIPRRIAFLAFTLAPVVLAGCGNQYRPVVSSVNPVGPAAQPEKFAVAISNTTPGSAAITAPTNQCGVAASSGTPGLVNLIDFSGDDLLTTVSVGVNPCYLQLDAGGDTGYTLNGDGTTNSFGITTSLIQSQVNQTTLPSGAAPVAILPQTTNLYIAESGLNAVAQLTQTSPPAFKQNLPTGQNTIYTVGVASAPRVYAISQGANGSVGTVAAIETNSNTISSTIPVGRGPVYGVMTADSRRAFILNKTDGTVSVINSQTNALDTFNNVTTNAVTSTIPVGNAPVWADFAPPLTELVVANQGNGTTAGSVSIISIPLCTASTVTSNPNCDPANPVDAVGFGQVVATIPVGINPVMVAVLQDGSQAFVANQGNATTPGSISVINLATDTVVATLPAGASTNELDSIVHGHPTWISATTGTPTGKVYVTSSDSTDLTIIRTDTDTVQTHLTLQGTGISVRVSAP